MTCIRVPGGFVCVGDSQIHTITVRGKPVRFEMTRFGPVTLTRAGVQCVATRAGGEGQVTPDDETTWIMGGFLRSPRLPAFDRLDPAPETWRTRRRPSRYGVDRYAERRYGDGPALRLQG